MSPKTKKVEEEPIEEEEPVEAEQVVAEVVEEEVAVEPEPTVPEEKSKPPGLVIISEMPTKNIKKTPISFVDNDALVLEWYNSRNGGQYYTLEEAAVDLDISMEEVENSLTRLSQKILPKSLDHITDYPTER